MYELNCRENEKTRLLVTDIQKRMNLFWYGNAILSRQAAFGQHSTAVMCAFNAAAGSTVQTHF